MAGNMTGRLVAGLRRVVHDLQPERMDARDAAELLGLFSEGERLCAAAKTLLIKRVDASLIWKHDGHRSAAHLLAATTGTSIGQAVAVVDTARRLDGLTRTEEELRAGRLSEAQVREVSAAAAEAPHAERDLLTRAQEDTYVGLRQAATQVKANATSAEAERVRYERIHRTRHVRFWRDHDGAGCGQWKLDPAADARLRAAIQSAQREIFRCARGEGRRESNEAYAADALVALADRALDGNTEKAPRSSARPTALLRIDATALRCGTTRDSEICEIAGVGPVPVAVAREMLGDALLKIVITRGVDVLNVTHVGRTRLAPVETALQWLYPECGVHRCHQRDRLEYHHTNPYRDTRHTKLSELVGLCRHHHDLVTHRRFTLAQRPDRQYDLVPPDGPDPPKGPDPPHPSEKPGGSHEFQRRNAGPPLPRDDQILGYQALGAT